MSSKNGGAYSIDYVGYNKSHMAFYRRMNEVQGSLDKRDLNTIYDITYKGYKFNCLPFIINGCSFLSHNFLGILYGKFGDISYKPDIIHLDEKIEGLDTYVLNSLIPSDTDKGSRWIAVKYYQRNPLDFARIMLRGSCNIVHDVLLHGNTKCINYSYDKICNTQAFSYYCIFLWMLSFDKSFGVYLANDIKALKLRDLISSLIPEESPHFRYIKGELTGKELSTEYIKESFKDGSSILFRELISNNDEGKYEGQDLTQSEISLCASLADELLVNQEYHVNLSHAYLYMCNGYYDKFDSEVKSLRQNVEALESNNEKMRIQLADSRSALEESRNALQEIKSENNSLKNTLSKVQKSEDLEAEIKKLKKQVSDLTMENNQLFADRIQLKQQCSSQIKEIKSLKARPLDEEKIEEVFEQEPTVSFEEMIDTIKDLSIGIIGFTEFCRLEENLVKLGVVNVKLFDSRTKDVGNCDYIVILTQLCEHSAVYRAEKLCKNKNTEILYYNGTNTNSFIELVYNANRKDYCE